MHCVDLVFFLVVALKIWDKIREKCPYLQNYHSKKINTVHNLITFSIVFTNVKHPMKTKVKILRGSLKNCENTKKNPILFTTRFARSLRRVVKCRPIWSHSLSATSTT